MFLRRGLIVFLAALSLLGSAELSFAEKRVALVIGNSGYSNAPTLPNPANDASSIAALLKTAGFDVVQTHRDLGIVAMRRALREFSNAVRNSDIAVVFFAGHGIEVDGINYLIPTDAKLESDFDVKDETISLDRVLEVAQPAKQLHLVILDACRENPFVKTMGRLVSTRAVTRGLARVEPSTSDTLIAFAAKAGSLASDGSGANSPFTAALLQYIALPGIDVRIALGKVRDEVIKNTAHKQEPFVYGSLGGETVSLVPLSSPIQTASPVPAVDLRAEARRDYELAAAVGTKDAWDYFLAQYTTGFYADLARAHRLKIIAAESLTKSSQVITAVPQQVEAPQAKLEAAAKAKADIESKAKVATIVKPGQSDEKTINDPSLLKEARNRLYELNFDPGPIEGTRSDLTEQAVREFQAKSNLVQTGQLTDGLLRRLREVGELRPWGAIVYAKRNNKWGMSWAEATRKDAVANARKACSDQPQECSFELSFFGVECAVFAHSETSWSIVARDKIERAKEAALADCGKRGNSCRIIASVCADGKERRSAAN